MPSSSKKTVIELCGLPGSGKTTLVRQLCEDKKFSRVELSTPGQIIRYFLYGLLRHPIYFVRGCLFAIQNKFSRQKFFGVFMYRYARYAKATLSRGSVCILDEGPKQSLYRYGLLLGNVSFCNDYLNSTPRNDLTIVFSVDETVRQAQLQKRNQIQSRECDVRTSTEEDLMLRIDQELQKVAVQTDGYHRVTSLGEAKEYLTKYVYGKN